MIKQGQKNIGCCLTFSFLSVRAFTASLAITITLTLLMLFLSSPSAYGECGVLCLHGKSNYNTGLSPYSVRDSISIARDSYDSFSISLMDSNNSSSEGFEDYILAASDVDTDSTLSASNPNDWEFIIIPYLWMLGINGDVTVKGRSADIDVGFSDILEYLDFAAEAHIEVWKGNFGVFIDPTYSKLSNSEDVDIRDIAAVDVDATFKFLLLEFGGFYRVGTWQIGSRTDTYSTKQAPSITLEALAGGRYWYLKSEIEIEGPLDIVIDREVEEDKSWFDFIVGARVKLNLTEKLILSVRSDIGGFNFGFSSDFAWNLVTTIGYELPWYRITPLIGYRVLYDDFDDGSGSDRFEYKTWTYGPIFGIAFRF